MFKWTTTNRTTASLRPSPSTLNDSLENPFKSRLLNVEHFARLEESARVALHLGAGREVVEGLALVEHIGDDNSGQKIGL